MTRKEEIEKANPYTDKVTCVECGGCWEGACFRRGAEWADKNPPMPNADAEKDYQDMRKFQEKFIAADQELSRLKQDVSEAAKILEKYYCYDGTRSAVDAKKWLSRHGGEDDK